MAIRRILVLMLGVTLLALVILAAAILTLAVLTLICRMTISNSISSSLHPLDARHPSPSGSLPLRRK